MSDNKEMVLSCVYNDLVCRAFGNNAQTIRRWEVAIFGKTFEDLTVHNFEHGISLLRSALNDMEQALFP